MSNDKPQLTYSTAARKAKRMAQTNIGQCYGLWVDNEAYEYESKKYGKPHFDPNLKTCADSILSLRVRRSPPMRELMMYVETELGDEETSPAAAIFCFDPQDEFVRDRACHYLSRPFTANGYALVQVSFISKGSQRIWLSGNGEVPVPGIEYKYWHTIVSASEHYAVFKQAIDWGWE
jgi:hypothetical protein